MVVSCSRWGFMSSCPLLLLLLVGGGVLHARAGTSTCHNETEFDCGDGQCIPLEWICDNVADCKNSKDEGRCLHVCQQGYMACRSGECVNADMKCDGFDDCYDGSDERACSAFTPSSPSQHTMQPMMSRCAGPDVYQCRKGPCVTRSTICDGNSDCPEHDDESNCPMLNTSAIKTCSEDQFRCLDAHCIPDTWVCDGNKDCGDGSDEVDCPAGGTAPVLGREAYFAQRSRFSCASGCDDGTCIPRSEMCDHTSQCPDGSDEGGQCGMCLAYGCQRSCIDSPHGPQCQCQSNEMLTSDSRSCERRDECAVGDGIHCSHHCIATASGFHCTCEDGYQLDVDGRTCHVTLNDVDSGTLYVATGQEVRQMPLLSHQSRMTPGYSRLVEIDVPGTMVQSLDFNSGNSQLFMSIRSVGGTIGYIYSYREQLQCLVENVKGINSVAVDWVTCNVYYAAGEPSKQPGIGVCSSDGRYCRLLATKEPGFAQFTGLALHPRRGKMFYSGFGNADAKIMQAGMDGTGVRVLADTKMTWPNGLTIDYVREHLYFSDAHHRIIERIDLETGIRTVVTTEGVHHPRDLLAFNGFIFWTDLSIDSLLMAALPDGTDRRVVHSLRDSPDGVTVRHPLYQKEQADPCLDAKCSHLCVLAPGNQKSGVVPRCLCPKSYVLAGTQCREKDGTSLRERRHSVDEPEMCTSQLRDLCDSGRACFNGGRCVTVSASSSSNQLSFVCECVNGHSGRFCEIGAEELVDVESAGSGWVLLLLLFLFSTLIAVFLLYKRRPDIIYLAADAVDRGARNSGRQIQSLTRRMGSMLPHQKEQTQLRKPSMPRGDAEASLPLVWDGEAGFANPMFDSSQKPILHHSVVADLNFQQKTTEQDTDSGIGAP